MNLRKTPCDECPWTRSSPPGRLGGSPPETYIGQALGPFQLPCHKACDFRDPEWKDKAFETLQCAGAAVFRTHIGVADRMPAALPCLPPSADVFGSMVEFMAHHKQIPLRLAKQQLLDKSPSEHLNDQLKRLDNQVKLIPRKTPP